MFASLSTVFTLFDPGNTVLTRASTRLRPLFPLPKRLEMASPQCLEDYTVGWICALPAELAAAQELLDEEHETPTYDARDTNI